MNCRSVYVLFLKKEEEFLAGWNLLARHGERSTNEMHGLTPTQIPSPRLTRVRKPTQIKWLRFVHGQTQWPW